MTKNLEEGQYIVYENDLKGVERSDQEELLKLIEQEPNTRFLGTSVGVLIYRFGRNFYDSTAVAEKLADTKEKLRQIGIQQDSLPLDRKLRKKEEKLESKVAGLERKLEFGNALMRTGNPVVILDSTLTEKTYRNLKGYLVNHGFFDAKVNYEVETKNQKAFVTYQITENKPYILDSVYTRSENEEIVRILNLNPQNSLIKKGEIYVQDNIAAERNRIEELLKNNGFYMFSRSYINYIAYQ
ncbi:MAG: POTRA domain-containing protein, partial [Algoriphagus aquaeductus]